MASVLEYDKEAARRLEAIYTTPDVVAQRREVLRALGLRPGERVLDIGSGPGMLVADMAAAVGPSGGVCGIDISESMLTIGRRRCSEAGITERVTFELSDVRDLPFADSTFDVAVSTQVYEYVDDVDRALAEVYRVLRPGGRLLVLDTDWESIVWHSRDRARMNRILAAWDDHLVDPRLPRTLSARMRQAGFRIQRRRIIPLLNPEYDPNTYSHGMAGLIAAFVPGHRGVTREDVEAWLEDLRQLGEAGRYFFSLNRYLFLAVKPDTGSD